MRTLSAGFVVSASLHLLLVVGWWWLVKAAPAEPLARPLPLTLAMFAEPLPSAAPVAPAETPPPPPKKTPPPPRPEPAATQPPAATSAAPAPPQEDVRVEEAPPPPPSVDTVEVVEMEEAYRAALRDLIESGKVYPVNARRLRHQGQVLLSFTIDPDGTISDVQIGSSSGSAILDEAALTLVRGLSGRLPAPAGLAQRRRSFTLPLAYRIK